MWIAAFVVSVGIGLFFVVVYSPQLLHSSHWVSLVWALSANTIIGLTYFGYLWKLVDYLNRRLPWEKSPGKRLLAEVVGVLFIILNVATGALIWFGLYAGDSWAEIRQRLSVEAYVNASYTPIIVTMFMEARGFLRQWRAALMRAERLRFANLEARHAYLQHQIKPHFLFNSLNVLASLVHKDADLAERFIHELSKLYRRLLEMDAHEVVPLAEEMAAFESYLFLVKMRFGESLQVQVGDFSALPEKCVPPFTLQLLLENAVKHNEMAKDRPVEISLAFDENHAVITNLLRPKARPDEKSTGIGLKNLRQRYALLSEQPLVVTKTEQQFVVKIPLLDPAEASPKRRLGAGA
jgi:hypothetical protein